MKETPENVILDLNVHSNNMQEQFSSSKYFHKRVPRLDQYKVNGYYGIVNVNMITDA